MSLQYVLSQDFKKLHLHVHKTVQKKTRASQAFSSYINITNNKDNIFFIFYFFILIRLSCKIQTFKAALDSLDWSEVVTMAGVCVSHRVTQLITVISDAKIKCLFIHILIINNNFFYFILLNHH